MIWVNILTDLIPVQLQNLEMFVRLFFRNIMTTPNTNVTEITMKTKIWRRRRRKKKKRKKKNSEKTRKILGVGLIMIVEQRDGSPM